MESASPVVPKSTAWARAHPEKHRECGRKFYRANRNKRLAYSAEWYRNNPHKLSEYKNRARLKKYGLTEDQYFAMLERCGGCCSVCGLKFVVMPHIDHDHSTGAVRGLLCSECNTGLGWFRDNPALLEKAAQYLRRVKLWNPPK